MIIEFVIAYFIFWVIYYIIVGSRNANMMLWQQKSSDPNLSPDTKSLETKYNMKWHQYDVYEKTLIHVLLTSFIFFIGGGITLFVSLLLLSVSLRVLVYNYCMNRFMDIDINHVGTCNWFDLLLRKLEDKGISQWTVKFGLLLTSIILITIFSLI